jgi:hypothetical protein
MPFRSNKGATYGQEFASTRGLSTKSYLDQLTVQPTYVWFIRRKVSFATLCLRVRRSSDNAEQDIGFVGGLLDTTALAAFVGANSGYVTTIYDQMGSGKNWVQATAANQPRIVNAGVIDAGFFFDGSNDGMTIASLTLGTQIFDLYHRMAITYGSYIGFLGTGAAYNTTGGFSHYTASGVFKTIISESTGANSYNSNQQVDSAGLRTRTSLNNRALAAGDEMRHFSNGVALTYAHDGNGNNNTGNFASQVANLGFIGGSGYFSGLAEGWVIYTADSSGIRTQIEALLP